MNYPITSLQNRVKFEWIDKCQEIFNKLKKMLTTTPILKITYRNMEFAVCTDACLEGLEGLLLQDNVVIAYESRKLKNINKTMFSMIWS